MNSKELVSAIITTHNRKPEMVVRAVKSVLRQTYKNITRYENGNDYLIYVLACLVSYTIVSTFTIIIPNLSLIHI